MDVGAGNKAGQQLIERGEIGADGDLERQDLLPVLVEEEGIRLPRLLGDEEHPVGRLHDGVEHARIGDQHVLQRNGKLHDDRATDAQIDPLRQRKCRIGGNAQHGIAAYLTTRFAAHIGRVHVADASRDKEHSSHTGASPL